MMTNCKIIGVKYAPGPYPPERKSWAISQGVYILFLNTTSKIDTKTNVMEYGIRYFAIRRIIRAGSSFEEKE